MDTTPALNLDPDSVPVPVPVPKPKRIGPVKAILGMWLHKTNPDLTEEEKVRAQVECRDQLKDARKRYGRTPPVAVLLRIDESIVLEILAHREKLLALHRTSPLTPPEPQRSSSTPQVAGAEDASPDGQDTNKSKPVKSAPSRARISEYDNLFKVIDQARKVRKEIDDMMKYEHKSPATHAGISPQVRAMIRDGDDVMKEILAMGARRNEEFDARNDGDPMTASNPQEMVS
ncbi:MAG: hypothetical protein WC655_24300 [Candidatus Hydrogenedentales bacterium]|jgi:hypothetical protein